ncbi:MAG: putative metal-binding motif-containing protein [Myxococcales bacterium]|nr:putative metal-binding motif-containing protein [Myxococcales bacterium]
MVRTSLVAALCALMGCPSSLPDNPCGTLIREGGRCVCPPDTVPVGDWLCEREDGTFDVHPDAPDGARPTDPLTPDGGPSTPDGGVDADPECIPTGPEICNGLDDDCDGLVDEELSRSCGESEVGACRLGTETCEAGEWVGCDAILPAEELCEPRGVDEDCDGAVDEGCPCVTGETRSCGTDVGACTLGTQTCTSGSWGACAGGVSPRLETCNGVDDDCDGNVDEGTGGGSCGTDVGECRRGTEVCVSGALQCQGSVGPVAEMCNGRDDNCNGVVDDVAPGSPQCWRDADGDSYAPMGAATICRPASGCPTGWTQRAPTAGNVDCDDSNPNVHPGRTEVCNGIDDNCSGAVDDVAASAPRCWRDVDGDTYAAASAASVCRPASGCATGWTTRAPTAGNIDCDDTNANIHPGRAEVCNGIDDNCNGQIDEGVTMTFYRDVDGDGVGRNSDTRVGCTAPSGYVAAGGDCDDNNRNVFPGQTTFFASPRSNGSFDYDCDGVDEPRWTTVVNAPTTGGLGGYPSCSCSLALDRSGWMPAGTFPETPVYSVPGCGVTRSFRGCSISGSSCVTTTQECR